MRIIFFFLYLFCCSSSLLGKERETSQTEVPNPANLSRNWWESLEKELSNTDSLIDFFVALKKQTSHFSKENQEEAQKLIQKIEENLETIIKLSEKGKSVESPPPIASVYTLDQLIDIHHQYRKNQIELQITEEDEEQKKQLIAKIQEKLDKLILNYEKASSHSEDKFMLGLEWIATRTELEANKKSLQLIQQNLENLRSFLNLRSREEDYAKYHLTSNHPEVRSYENKAIAAKKVWDQKRQSMTSQETNFMTMSLLNSCEVDEVKKQLDVLQEFRSAIEEAGAHLAFIQASLLANLAKLVVQKPGEEELETFNENAKTWKNDLEVIENSFIDWRKRLEIITQRNEQIVCITENPAPLPPNDPLRLHTELVESGKKNLQLIPYLESEWADTIFLFRSFEDNLIPYLGHHTKWLDQFSSFFQSSYDSIGDWMSHTVFYVGNYPVTVFSILRFLAILFLTFWITRLVTKALTTLGSKKRGIQHSLLYRINRLVSYLILFIGTLFALSSIGFDLSNFLLVAGALGVGLGFGLQSIFNNFISGIIILFESNLKVGDFIELENGTKGEVRAINVRSTVLRTYDGIEVLIPNAELVTTKVTNWTLSDPFRRVHIPFSVPYGVDKDRIVQLIINAAKKEPMTLLRSGIPEPAVYMTQFGESGLDMELLVWIDERASRHSKNTLSTYLWLIDNTLREHHISMPFPHQDINIVSMPPFQSTK